VPVRLTRAQLGTMVAHAHAEAPNECCGVLLGTGDVVVDVFPGRNVHQSPTVYEMDPRDLLRAFRMMDERGWDLVGIYHSHPRTQARPSETDKARALYPDARYVIISLADPARPDVRAFRITDRTNGDGTTVKDVTEEDVVVT